MSTHTDTDLADFVAAYEECALWATVDYGDEGDDQGDHHGMLDDRCDTFADDAHEAIVAECEDFLNGGADQLIQTAITEDGYSYEQAGHDFFLTRNGHGAGFWDRGLGTVGDELTDMAHVYGETNYWAGDDDLVQVD